MEPQTPSASSRRRLFHRSHAVEAAGEVREGIGESDRTSQADVRTDVLPVSRVSAGLNGVAASARADEIELHPTIRQLRNHAELQSAAGLAQNRPVKPLRKPTRLRVDELEQRLLRAVRLHVRRRLKIRRRLDDAAHKRKETGDKPRSQCVLLTKPAMRTVIKLFRAVQALRLHKAEEGVVRRSRKAHTARASLRGPRTSDGRGFLEPEGGIRPGEDDL